VSEPDRLAGKHALLAFLIVGVLVAGLVHINVTIPVLGQLGSACVALLFIYTPVFAAWRRDENLEDYGLRSDPIAKNLAIAGLSIAIIIPLFSLTYFAFYEIACNSSLLAHLVPHQMCGRYGGLSGLHAPVLTLTSGSGAPTLSIEFILTQMLVVALPEELFFRGFLLTMLERRFPPKRRWMGGGVGLALVLSAAAFAIIHLPKDGDPRALATFFPGLLFGWMRSATGSLLPSTITHGFSNILVRALDLCVQR
jgi:membrane protease YdiL (CAAX protease family)